MHPFIHRIGDTKFPYEAVTLPGRTSPHPGVWQYMIVKVPWSSTTRWHSVCAPTYLSQWFPKKMMWWCKFLLVPTSIQLAWQPATYTEMQWYSCIASPANTVVGTRTTTSHFSINPIRVRHQVVRILTFCIIAQVTSIIAFTAIPFSKT